MRIAKAFFMIGLSCCFMGLSGCCGIKETSRGFLGISTKILEDKRPEAISAKFSLPYRDCYEKARQVLQKSGSYIYASRKDLIAVYLSKSDTTPAGVFFREIDGSDTEVSISSPSTYAKELLSKTLFAGLEKPLNPEK